MKCETLDNFFSPYYQVLSREDLIQRDNWLIQCNRGSQLRETIEHEREGRKIRMVL